MTGRMTGRTDSGEASFLILTSFNICNNIFFFAFWQNFAEIKKNADPKCKKLRGEMSSL